MLVKIKRETVYDEVELDPLDVMTVKEAADLLGVRMPTINGYIDHGTVTLVENPAVGQHQGRRLLLRNEVNQLARRGKTEISHAEAAQLLGVGKSQVSRLVSAGKLTLTQEGIREYLANKEVISEPIQP
jgi:excisionase family DNA binding protein